MGGVRSRFQYYFGATYRRKILDKLLDKTKGYYKGIILDIGGRDRGNFQKPKNKVENWIFVDIEEKYNPDVIMDIEDMTQIGTGTIDVVNAIEVFEHVKNPRKGLQECSRILKKKGAMVLSIPFLYPIHADPNDFQRWTEKKWKEEIETIGFTIDKFEIMGRYFTVLGDTIKFLIKSMPRILRWMLYFSYPLLDLIIRLDSLKFIQNHPKLGRFHGGYFAILQK